MYFKVGRDENNFYMYRAPVNAGPTAAAWTDFAIDLSRFIELRKKIQTAYLAGKRHLDRLHRRRLGDHRGVAAAGRASCRTDSRRARTATWSTRSIRRSPRRI